jgi:hypothetical protein
LQLKEFIVRTLSGHMFQPPHWTKSKISPMKKYHL